jgi:hypothetical protein
MRDAHSQTVRKKNREMARILLTCNQQDSVAKGIKLLGFTDLRAYLVSLNKLALANKQLQTKGIILNNLAPAALAQAYRMVSQRSRHIYPPIKAQSASNKVGSATYKTSAYGICELCFLNNCDECGEFGEANTQLEQPSNDKGGSGGNPCYDRARVNRESDVDIATVGMAAGLLGCGMTAGEVAGATTVATIATGPLAPVIGGGVGGIYITVCAGSVIIVYSATLNKIEADYQKALAECHN